MSHEKESVARQARDEAPGLLLDGAAEAAVAGIDLLTDHKSASVAAEGLAHGIEPVVNGLSDLSSAFEGASAVGDLAGEVAGALLGAVGEALSGLG